MLGSVKRSWWCVLSVGLAVAVMGSSATAVTVAKLQPNEADSEDVFTYQFEGAGFGIAPSAAQQNLDTQSVGAPIGLFLGTSRSATTIHSIDAGGLLPGDPSGNFNPSTAVDVETGHNGRSWLKFDLSGVGVTAGQVGKATLNLWSLDGFNITGSFYNPIAAEPVETEVYAAAGPWDEQTLSWTTQGPVEPVFGSPVDSVIQTSVGQWVSFDVTSLVKDWLNNPAANNGFVLRQKEIVFSAQGAVLPTAVVSSLYASSWFGDPNAPNGFNAPGDAALRPFLLIEAVPEPATVVMSLMAAGSLVLAIRRRA